MAAFSGDCQSKMGGWKDQDGITVGERSTGDLKLGEPTHGWRSPMGLSVNWQKDCRRAEALRAIYPIRKCIPPRLQIAQGRFWTVYLQPFLLTGSGGNLPLGLPCSGKAVT